MDRRFLFPNYLNSDYKLTRAASYSELSSTKKFIIEEELHSKKSEKLIKQYSCEQIFDLTTKTSQINISHILKSENEEHASTWKAMLPADDSLKNSVWSECNRSTQPDSQQFSFSNQNLAMTDHLKSKQILAPAKLMLQDKKMDVAHQNNQSQIINQDHTDNKVINEPIFGSKKSSILTENISKNDNINDDEKIIDDCDINKKDSIRQINKNILEGTENILDNTEKYDTSDLTKRLESLDQNKEKKITNIRQCWPLIFIILFSLTGVYISIFLVNTNFLNDLCDPHFQINKIPQDLKNSLYGQDAAVQKLSKYFIEKNNEKGFDVLILIGGIGVGKSYTAEIIKNNLKDTYNIVDLYSPIYRKENRAYESLSICQCNLIRLENLKTDDIVDTAQFVSYLQKKAKKYCILILALFNTEETDMNLKKSLDLDKSVSIIHEKFEEKHVKPTLVRFIKMSDEALIKCIKNAAEYTNVKLTNSDIEYVKRDLLSFDSGCKGAYAKVQIMGRAAKSDL